MLSFAAMMPHPPIIIPEIGGVDTKYAQKTIEAMKTISASIEDHDLDTVIFISPHTILSPDSMIISYAENAAGNFSQFNHPEIGFESEMDIETISKIITKSQTEKIPLRINDHDKTFILDHGVLVPYYYLQENLHSTCKIIVIGFSYLPRLTHLAFGQIIGEVAKKIDKNIGIIASGDLSHRILEEGSEFIGQKFDKMIVDAVSQNKTADILKVDEHFQEEAGECGYRSLAILIGALDGVDTQSEVLSYEAPFGVGYMVVNFNLK